MPLAVFLPGLCFCYLVSLSFNWCPHSCSVFGGGAITSFRNKRNESMADLVLLIFGPTFFLLFCHCCRIVSFCLVFFLRLTCVFFFDQICYLYLSYLLWVLFIYFFFFCNGVKRLQPTVSFLRLVYVFECVT